jgi:hypothetical protein
MLSLLVFDRDYRLEIQSVMLVFSTHVNCCPFDLLSGSPPPLLPPFPKSKYSKYRQCVAGRGWGGGVLSCVGDHILKEFNSVSDQIQNLPNCISTPNKKPGRGWGLRKTLYRLIFLDKDIWH